MRFAMHHKFESAFCNPGKGNEKGSVENKVGYHRRNFFVPVPEFKDLEDYNKKLLEMCNNDMERLHYKKGVTIQELFEQEKESFLPLPLIPFEVFRQEIKGTAKDPRSREQQFLTKSSGRMTVRIRGEEDEVGEHMPIKHDFLRAKAAQEDFGGNERRTPYRDDGDGDDITADLALHGRPIRDYIVARYAAACRKEPSCAARHRVAYKPMKVARAFIINLLPFRIIWSDKAKPRMLF